MASHLAMEGAESKARLTSRLMAAKRRSGKTYSEIAAETGLTNVYVAQLLRRQAPLTLATAAKLQQSLPELDQELVQAMLATPLRSYDPAIIQDPAIYRLNEAIMHNGESIKDIINEELGDGIMSAIDFYCSVDQVVGVDGKARVVITFDGKFLPYTVQEEEHMVSRKRPQGSS